MRIFKNRMFSRWATKESISDSLLLAAVGEIDCGLIDANLGGGIVKKRVAIGNRGKSAGARTLLAYRMDDKAFFIYGFAKNVRSNIRANELTGLKAYADLLLNYSDTELAQALKHGALIEVKNDG